jgi:nucleoside transporter
MNPSVRGRLSVMMFLQFFIWGAWFVTLGTYLGQGLKLGGDAIGSAYSTMPWGAIVAPFLVGMIADRFFPAQIVLGICHLLGAGLLYYASTVTDPAVLFWVLLGYAMTYSPTLALVNAISFNQMTSPQKQFPAIRVFGTLGWIVAGLAVGWMGVEQTATPMKIAAGCAALMGLFSFALPHTPPKSLGHKVTVSDVLGLDALKLMKDPSFAIFVIGSLLVCIPLSFYYSFTNLFLNEMGVSNAAGKQTMGQMSEVFFMLVMPFFFVRLGVKKMLLFGMLAWAVRYVLFAFGNPGPLVALYYGGILLHGICYDFFFVTGQIYVDKTAPKKIQASAQGFIGVVTYGIGMVIGAKVAGLVVQHFQEKAKASAGLLGQAAELIQGKLPEKALAEQWQNIWIVPAIMAGVVILLFAIFFREPKETVNEGEGTANGEAAPQDAASA